MTGGIYIELVNGAFLKGWRRAPHNELVCEVGNLPQYLTAG
jgi:hypothetical protein